MNRNKQSASSKQQLSTGGLAFTDWRDYIGATQADRIISAANSSAHWGCALEAKKFKVYEYALNMVCESNLTCREGAATMEALSEYLDLQVAPPPVQDILGYWKEVAYGMVMAAIQDGAV